MKKQAAKYLLWLPATAVMCMIFCFSQMDADASSHLSGGIVERVLTFFGTHGAAWLLDSQKAFDTAEFLIRKCAHASEYALLGVTFVIPLKFHVGLAGKKLACVSVLAAVLYACTDEFHQLFISGRSGQLLDVGIDSLGACIGVMLCMLVLQIVHRHKGEN